MIPSEEFVDNGTMLALEVCVIGVKAVPWKAPNSKSGIKKSTGAHYRIHYSNKKVKEFQSKIKDACVSKFADRKPYAGPIHLEIVIRRKTKDTSLYGTYAYKEEEDSAVGFGDLRNICKAIEDALQGVAFFRDSQVCSTKDTSFWSSRDSILIRVFTVSRDPN